MPARILVAAPASGSGKTTFTLGLLDALRRRGLAVQPFKAGPDFIDPSHHTRVAGRASRNLDTWLCGDDAVREIFVRAASCAEISVVEGVMGLYDGFGPRDERGSSAHLARLLDCPVLLVVDAQRCATSAAAVALGFQRFDERVRLAGVVFNNVGSPGHYEWLGTTLEDHTGLASFGYLASDDALRIEERHLGLVPADERPPPESLQARLRGQFDDHVDVAAIVAAASAAPDVAPPVERMFETGAVPPRARIGVARDAALNFYYEENLDLLAHAGAEIVMFSVLHDRDLPPGVQGLYLGGGFPEMFAARLAANAAMRAALRAFHAGGGRIYAECGGLMVLCEAIIDFDGRRHEMAGLVPATAVMRRDRLSLGYCEVETIKDTVIAPAGARYRAQTFHHSVLAETRFEPATRLTHGGNVSQDGYAADGVFATYVHAHFAARPDLARRFVDQCARGVCQ